VKLPLGSEEVHEEVHEDGVTKAIADTLQTVPDTLIAPFSREPVTHGVCKRPEEKIGLLIRLILDIHFARLILFLNKLDRFSSTSYA
jgi:hypothetical protein